MMSIDIATQILSIMKQTNHNFLTQGSMLKSLYCLIQSSLSYDVSRKDCHAMAVENNKLKVDNMTTLSSMLFEELRERLSCILHKAPMDRDTDWTSLHADSRDSMEELLLLLRCCVLIVRLYPLDHTLMQKFLDVVCLHRIFPFQSSRVERGSMNFTRVASSQSMCSSRSNFLSNDMCAKSCNSCILLIKRMLEVILDEMFVDRQFRERIATLNTSSFSKGNRATCSSVHIESMIDVIVAHFILSLSGEQFLEFFTQSLILTKKQTVCSPELSLSAAISLLKHPLMSPPILVRAHLISMVSDVIGICDSCNMSRNIRYMEYLSVLRDSVIMYCEHMSKLLRGSCGSPYELRRRPMRVVESHFHSKICDKVNFMLTACDTSWRENIGRNSSDAKSSLKSDAITYLKMNMYIFDESSRDEMFSFLNSLIIRVFSSEADEIIYLKIKKMTIQDFCLLASMLKLMSCSLLQATSLRKRLISTQPSPKATYAPPGCHSLTGMMSSLVEYDLHLPLPVQELIDGALRSCHTSHDDSKVILKHFAGLLSLCKVTGLNFLVKGCLFTILVFMNMAIFEECSLEFLRPSPKSCLESHSLASSTVNLTSAPTCISHKDSFCRIQKSCVRKVSILRVASDFQRIRKLLLRGTTAYEERETINGEAYLKHFISDPEIVSELADFIVCEPEKNYTAWLRNRADSRQKRSKKLAIRQWQRKKAACNSMGRLTRRKVHPKF